MERGKPMLLKKLLASLGVLICVGANASTITYAETAVPFIYNDISLAYEIATTN